MKLQLFILNSLWLGFENTQSWENVIAVGHICHNNRCSKYFGWLYIQIILFVLIAVRTQVPCFFFFSSASYSPWRHNELWDSVKAESSNLDQLLSRLWLVQPINRRVASTKSNCSESKIATKLFIAELYRINNSNFYIKLETKCSCMTWTSSVQGFLRSSRLAFVKTCLWSSSGTSLGSCFALLLVHYHFGVIHLLKIKFNNKKIKFTIVYIQFQHVTERKPTSTGRKFKFNTHVFFRQSGAWVWR